MMLTAPRDTYIFRSDRRLRLRRIIRHRALGNDRWEVSFERSPAALVCGVALHRSFTVAVVTALWRTIGMPSRRGRQ
jgi:hypothetical protein